MKTCWPLIGWGGDLEIRLTRRAAVAPGGDCLYHCDPGSAEHQEKSALLSFETKPHLENSAC